MQYVRLKTSGLERLAEIYKDKAAIHVEEIKFEESQRFWYGRGLVKDKEDLLYGKIIRVADELPSNQAQGLIINATNQEGYLMHTLFFLVAKGEDGLVRVLDFEEDLPEISNETGLANINYGMRAGNFDVLPINVDNYHNHSDRDKIAQKDPHSCSVMAIDILKNFLIDAEFLKGVMSFKPQANQRNSVELPKIILGQGSEYIDKLSSDKKAKYVLGEEGHDVNYKTFYKGHDYATKLNPEHLYSLNPKSAEIFQQISQRRREFKATSGEQLVSQHSQEIGHC